MYETNDLIDRHGISAAEIASIKHGYLPACGEVTPGMAYSFNSWLRFLCAEHPGRTVTVSVSGPGGSVDAGLSMIDACRCSGAEIRVLATGMCASMSAVLAICCARKGERYCTPNTTYMLHEVLGGASGRASDVERTCERMLATRSRIEKMLAEACDLPIERVQSLCRQGDRYLSAEEAKSYGLVDHIIEWK